MAKKTKEVEELSPLEASRPDAAQIAEWKKKYGQYGPLYKLAVKNKKGEELFAIMRTPKMVDMEGASKEARKSPLSSVKYIVSNCSLYMDAEIRKNDSLFMSLCAKAEEVVNISEATLEEL